MIVLAVVLAIGIAAACGLFLVSFGENGYSAGRFFSMVVGVALIVGSGVSCLLSVPLGFDWLAAGEKARIINREYGTSYTQREVFFASSVIDEVRELNRKRVEVNGDLFREKDE